MKAKDCEPLPICLVVSTGATDPNIIIQGITGGSTMVDKNEDGLPFYKWDIVTKYYTATINVCHLMEKTLVGRVFAANVEAVVIYSDSNNIDGLKEVDQWLPFVNEFEPEIKILVCDRCAIEEGDQQRYSKYDAQKWCITNGFELVELDPSEEVDPDDDFPETLGLQRIVQALHAHSWPNLLLRSTAEVDKSRIDHLSRLLLGENIMESNRDESVSGHSAAVPVTEDALQPTEEDSSVESFDQLFQQLCTMKSQVDNMQLGSADRRAYAEKVTMAFWRAMDGDEDEIQGLADED